MKHINEVNEAIKTMLGSENTAIFKQLGANAYHSLKPNLATSQEGLLALMLAQQYMILEELRKINANLTKEEVVEKEAQKKPVK